MKAIIIGATSGIGRELAKNMSAQGYVVGITGRRSYLLDSLEEELHGECFKAVIDLTKTDEATITFENLLNQMGNVDIVVINSGFDSVDPDYPLEDELRTIAVNVTGFSLIANIAFRYFSNRKQGHIVGVSSIAGLRGGNVAAYNASKAYVSNYLEGLFCRSFKQNTHIDITDIRPGFVDTDMAKGEGVFWKAPVEIAVQQIINAIHKKQRIAYITKRWRLIAWFLKCIPFVVYRRMIG